MSLNQIVLMGRLTAAPELRYTQSQTPVCSFRLACERDYAESGGERKTDFVDAVAWRGLGEFVSKYFSKGSMAVVSGRLQMRDWTDRDGNKRTNAEIVADHVYFGEGRRSVAVLAAAAQSGFTPAAAQVNVAPEAKPTLSPVQGTFRELNDVDGELPF